VLGRVGQQMDLKQDAFKIFEDGAEQQISFFSAGESPVSWVMSKGMNTMDKKMMKQGMNMMKKG
jgi:hypothetical protein